MLFTKKLKLFAVSSLMLASVVFAVTLSDLETDAEGQKVVSLYGVDSTSGLDTTQYNDAILKIPEEVICLIRQVWKPELVGLGNIHVEINDKKCIGNQEGRDKIQGVFNLSIDAQTGNTIGKLWLDDQDSLIYPNKNITTYIQLSVESSPSASEPFGRFVLDTVDEDRAAPETPLLVAQVIASGTVFKISGRDTYSSFAGYVDGSLRQAVYQIADQEVTALGFNDEQICFKRGSSQDCFPRSLSASSTNPHVKVNAWSYGIYNLDGSRFDGLTANIPLRLTDNVNAETYELVNGFGGSLRNIGIADFGGRPGGSTANGSDAAFWVNKQVFMDSADNSAQPTPKKLQWLVKTHSVDLLAAKPIGDPSINTSGIALTLSSSVLSNLAPADPARAKAIGLLPAEVLNAPLKVKAGRVL